MLQLCRNRLKTEQNCRTAIDVGKNPLLLVVSCYKLGIYCQ